MITSMTWIPKGAARSVPLRYELSAEERDRVRQLAADEATKRNRGEEAEHEAAGRTFSAPDAASAMETEEETLEEFHLDDYDDDDEDRALHQVDFEDADQGHMVELVDSGAQAVAVGMDSDEEDDDAEDNEIRPGDSLFCVAHTDDEDSHIEVQLYNEEEGTLYIHHDIYLPEFPLCMAWLDCPPFLNNGTQLSVGNYLAVGTFSPAIEIWNLDVLDPLEPTATLGGMAESSKKKSKKSSSKFAAGSHTDSVLGLAWNKTYRQALASASADTNIKIWDVTTQACSHTFEQHTDKVQNVLWHPTEGWLLASAAFDKTVGLFDCRSGAQVMSARLETDPESLAWNPNEPNHLYCSLEDGQVACIDVRQSTGPGGVVNPLFTFRAHEETASSISFSTLVPGMMATSSVDQTVKVWDVLAASRGAGTPKTIAYKTMNVGKIFAMTFSNDIPYLLACGGDRGMVAVWESDELDVVRKYFSGREPFGSSTAAAVSSVSFGGMSLKPSADDADADAALDELQEAVIMNGGEDKKKKKKKSKK